MSDLRERHRRAILMPLAVVLGMGPTIGDIGSCAQPADQLDAPTFFFIKAGVDCDRCGECGLRTKLCESACTAPTRASFPAGCRPLVHDGEVCLRALIHASCDDYAAYVNDGAPTAPSECQFCPIR